MSVEYDDMDGIDAGGLLQDFMTRLATALSDTGLGVLDASLVDGEW